MRPNPKGVATMNKRRRQVKRYIANQNEHHRKLSFQDEVRALLTKHDVEWDERYIGD